LAELERNCWDWRGLLRQLRGREIGDTPTPSQKISTLQHSSLSKSTTNFIGIYIMELLQIDSKSVEDAKVIIEKFNIDHAQSMNFPQLRLVQDRINAWRNLFSILENDKFEEIHLDCLVAARLMSRDKNGLNESVSKEIIEILLNHAGLGLENDTIKDQLIAHQSEMVLSNLIHQSSVVQTLCTQNDLVKRVLDRMSKYNEKTIGNDIKKFDARLLFLMTALCPEERSIARETGLIRLTEMVEDVVTEAAGKGDAIVNEDQAGLLVEMLKLAFNLTLAKDSPEETEEEEQLSLFCSSIHRLLSLGVCRTDLQMQIHNHIINVVTNLPGYATRALIGPRDPALATSARPDISVKFEGHTLNSPRLFLDFLFKKLETPSTGLSLKEDITPVLSVLCSLSRSHRAIRKYFRSEVLPPLKAADVAHKPEVGDSYRAQLVRLLTSNSGDVAILIEEFIFILCKENVSRMVKYTGYGNAAGFLARKGFLLGGRGNEASTFSDDEDTDDDDDLQNVNPLTGCVEQKRPNPLEGMSEEQKEYEAVKLINLMDKMNRSGVIQPCRIGADGKPEPVEHVLQLQENLENLNVDKQNEESDSD